MTEDDTHLMTPDEFLTSFFAPPNRIEFSHVFRPDGKWKHVRPLVDQLQLDPIRPTVLPYWGAERTYWYGLAFSEAQLSELRDDLTAFVGPSYSTFRGNRAVLDPGDPIEAAVLGLTNGLAFKLTGPREKDDPKAIWTALQLMSRVASRRPLRDLEVPRPTGRVLRDFYMALRAGNAASADSFLHYLAERNRLDPINILFLRVQAFAELANWTAIVAQPELPDLLQMRRPLSVTEALMRAVYHVELERFEQPPDPAAAVAHFRSSVLPQYGGLLTRRAGVRAPAALKLLMLLAVGGEPPNPTLRDELLVAAGLVERDQAFLQLLAQQFTVSATVTPSDALAAAVDAATHGDYDDALAAALEASPSVMRTRLLLQCAYELQTLAVERHAVAAVDALDGEQRADVLRSRHHREIYQAFVASNTQAMKALSPDTLVPSDWIAWLARVENDDGWESALDVARRGSTEWLISDLSGSPGSSQRLAKKLTEMGNVEVVQDALPHLLSFLQRDDAWPRREFVSVYVAMMEVLALTSTGSEDDLTEFYELSEAVLSFGPNARLYADFVEQARYLLTKVDSLARVPWGLDVMDLMFIHPCPQPDLRIGFLSDVAALFQKYRRRLDAGLWDLFRGLSEDLGHPDVVRALVTTLPESTVGLNGVPSDAFGPLQNKVVGVYTLTESVGRRVRDLLIRRAPGVRVEISNDKVGTDRLKHIARNAHIMIVATASATHAATVFIDSQRGKDDSRQPTLRPAGKGSASMLNALYGYLLRGGVDAKS